MFGLVLLNTSAPSVKLNETGVILTSSKLAASGVATVNDPVMESPGVRTGPVAVVKSFPV